MIKKLKEKMLLWFIKYSSAKMLDTFLHYTKTDPNTVYPKIKNNALMVAILYGKLDSAEVLIKRGADVNAKFQNISVLDTALITPDEKALSLLIKNNVNLNEDINPISIAVLHQNMRAIWYLVDEGVDINKQPNTCDAPIFMALNLDNEDILYHLLQIKGIDVNKRGVRNTTPLATALIQDKIEHARLLIKKKADVNAVFDGGYRALDIAIKKNNLEAVKELIKAQAQVNYIRADNLTPLMAAQSPQIIEELSKMGAINFGNAYGETPLLYAIANQQTEKAKYLIDNGADLSLVTDHGYSYLLFAVIYEEKEILQSLLDNKCPLDPVDDQGKTPLLVALETEQYDVVKKLLEYGANPNILFHGIPIGAIITHKNPSFLPLIKKAVQKYHHQISRVEPKKVLIQKGTENAFQNTKNNNNQKIMQ